METTVKNPAKSSKKTHLTKNIVQFRSNFVNLPDAGKDNRGMAMSVMSELMQFGYMLTPEAIDNIAAAESKHVEEFHDEVIAYLKKMTGSGRNYKPFWPGFPQQVMEMSEFELWLHQIMHYMTRGGYVPDEWTKTKPTAFEHPKYHTISVGDDSRFEQIFTDLVSVNQSLTPDDLEVIKWFVSSGSTLRFPDRVPFKENLCTLAAMGLDVPVKTVTDVLRIAVGMSDGDISLPAVPPAMVRANRWSSSLSENEERTKFEFRKFNRSERRRILSLLEKTNCDASEAVLRDQRWVRLGEILHPGEYKEKFPRSFKMFDAIRNKKDRKTKSWYGKVDGAFSKSFEAGLDVLSQRPGEFVRRLDWMVRFHGKKIPRRSAAEKYSTGKYSVTEDLKARTNLALDKFAEIADKISNKVLFEVYNHFEGRYVGNESRSVMIKGQRKRTPLPPLPSIDPNTIESIQRTVVKALMSKFAKLPDLGRVYVDEKLRDIPMPTNMRTASSSLRPRIRGQRTPIGNQNAKVIRAFVHWYDDHGTEDLDLHGMLVGDRTEYIGWNAHHQSSYGCHSGDIIRRQGACAEYVDINIENALEDGFRYVIISVNNFTGRPFHTVKECVTGYMEREYPEATKTFVPATLANCIQLTNEKSTTLVSVIDLETREFIHLDIDMNGIPVSSMKGDQIMDAIKPYCEPPKFSVYDLVMLHVESRKGKLIKDADKADVRFGFDNFSDSYIETMKLMGV